MIEDMNRRPLASRKTAWAAALTRRLAATRITPNQISAASISMAAVSGAAFWLAGSTEGAIRGGLLICAATFCQLRLLCNLLDGMVAIEAGKKASDGAFWNEFPDRIADILILAGAGYGIGEPALGWAAAAFAVFTAYTRELGRVSGAQPDFSGPMAKPHRMAVMTAAALLSLFEPLWNGRNEVLIVALWLVTIGAVVTTLRRASRLLTHLRS
ncbi:CDP-diacylglycerol--glycerol-3-phosphate 3-phosphatidyltransferase [Paramesorhizobium deserti]|uniref:CDP-diacylglycerol--glycerol-3-phosphate 3-phosphatidyltransferase n=1 Tax=Paramesorhizobium deserti TaxID=1494590 RepID=A0A135HR76_9HYPH|nr:CDP-alcohol phosphatidyltransferase family protein [Paramesorhizobium deserti]KXF75643.1 CDP-diacylglycerol--glycerol-3-phosphate 3-phosphatidyltransferase [Paramesorhizobium deserti]